MTPAPANRDPGMTGLRAGPHLRRRPDPRGPDHQPLGRAFFERHVVAVARDLVGMRLQWGRCAGRVVETEAYAAAHDPACHTATRVAARAFMRDHRPGTAYVYLNYGVHWLFNVLVKNPRDPAGDGLILIRALEPLEGIGLMRRRRRREDRTDLCSGPGKLTSALAIDQRHHGRDVAVWRWVGGFTNGSGPLAPVGAGPRIGIRRATDYPWRFFERDNPHVS